eukprot:gene20041-biopygen22083
MGPQPHTYGRGRFFRGRAGGPFFAAGFFSGPGGPTLQLPGRSPLPPQRARPTVYAPALQTPGRTPPGGPSGGGSKNRQSGPECTKNDEFCTFT